MSNKWKETWKGSIRYIDQEGGPRLGLSAESGVNVLTVDGLAFKDLSRNGKLDPYEDWRLPAVERAKDLASRMTIGQIAGLMLYSPHQAVPGTIGFMPATYGGKPFAESGAAVDALSDQQIAFLTADEVRHVLVMGVESPAAAARWSNNVQTLVEGMGLGIPANNSSDPRHGTSGSAEFNAGAGGRISMWPEPLGLAATFEPELVRQFGEIAAKEYRALGLTTALSPQIDLATDPRWMRANGTFGEDSQLAADLAKAYIDGFQTSEGGREIAGGWGYDSVNAMVKHWPGGGTGEGGRDAHFGYGKFAVYPGGNFAEHLLPFTEGAFNLAGGTGQASAVMPYYTISYNRDVENGENVGNSYSRYLIADLLREKYGYEGVVCTDWGITADEGDDITKLFPGGRCWGVEEGYTVAERHYKLLMAGVDQFGGNSEAGPIIEAYAIGAAEHGEPFMRRRFEQSAVRLLVNIFRLGLFENPYVDEEETVRIVGQPAFVAAGFEAQRKSVVMVKNTDHTLPLSKETTVYVPKRYVAAGVNWFGTPTPESFAYPIDLDAVRQYVRVTDDPAEADVALVCIEGADSGFGYSREDAEAGGNGYVPISLQYGPYTAEHARETSLAGDARGKDVLNRSYRGKTVTARNKADLDLVLETKRAMNGKPVIVSLTLAKPTIFHEFEPAADAILVNFGVRTQAILDLLTGAAEPSGLLPLQMPADMRTVEEQHEDVAHDMKAHVDTEGNTYDFGFGLNWSGVIRDERTARYGPGRAGRP